MEERTLWLPRELWWTLFEACDWEPALGLVCTEWRTIYYGRDWISNAPESHLLKESFARLVWQRPTDWPEVDRLPLRSRSTLAHSLARHLSLLSVDVPNSPDPTCLLFRMLPLSDEAKPKAVLFEIPAFPEFESMYVRALLSDLRNFYDVWDTFQDSVKRGRVNFANAIVDSAPDCSCTCLLESNFWETDNPLPMNLLRRIFQGDPIWVLGSYAKFVSKCLSCPLKSVPMDIRRLVRASIRNQKVDGVFPVELRSCLVFLVLHPNVEPFATFQVLLEDLSACNIPGMVEDILRSFALRDSRFGKRHFRSLLNTFPRPSFLEAMTNGNFSVPGQLQVLRKEYKRTLR